MGRKRYLFSSAANPTGTGCREQQGFAHSRYGGEGQMKTWMYFASTVGLSVSLALAGTGCMGQETDEQEAAAGATARVDQPSDTAAKDDVAAEATGEANQALFGGLGAGFAFNRLLAGACGIRYPVFPLGFGCGCGFGGFGGCW
jgi:hypothetical protein